MNGIINVLKPSAMTSHDVVNFIRKTLNMKKVGHTGTLDPNAAGVLPICIGKSTKLIEYIQYENKKYRTELTLGFSTDTQDKYGKILDKSKKNISKDTIIEVINSFVGKTTQIPPMYSALKHNGKRLYELARKGKSVERKSREIYIESIDIVTIKNNKIIFDVTCSKGTYVRTLCNDIGEKLGTFGHMSFLERLKVGDFEVKFSHTLESISRKVESNDFSFILPMDFAVKSMEKFIIDKKFYKHISNGLNIDTERLRIYKFKLDTEYKIYCDETFIGIGSIVFKNNCTVLKMNKVLI